MSEFVIAKHMLMIHLEVDFCSSVCSDLTRKRTSRALLLFLKSSTLKILDRIKFYDLKNWIN